MLRAALIAALVGAGTAAEVDLSRPINTVCPVDGAPIDRSRDPIVLSVASARGTELVPVGVCAKPEDAAALRAHPADYLDAARHDALADPAREDAIARRARLGAHALTTMREPGKPAHPGDRSPLDNQRPNGLVMALGSRDGDTGAPARAIDHGSAVGAGGDAVAAPPRAAQRGDVRARPGPP